MAFTAGSPELAKANALGNDLAHLISVSGFNGISAGLTGATGAAIIEKYARKLGFGITGLTTGAAFPPFGTATVSLGIEASLQNPRGETMANGITIGAYVGNTLGIYLKKFVRSGADYTATVFSGLTLQAATTVAGTTFSINGPFTAHTNDLLVFGNTSYKISGGNTAAASGAKAEVTVGSAIGVVYAAGQAFNIQTIGVTRGTSGIAGSTSESYRSGTQVNGGFTAAIWFSAPSGGSGTWVVS